MSGFRLKSIDFRDSNSTRVPLGKLTVLVGPNNSGKSKTLKEIRSMVLGVLSVDEGISCHSDIPDAVVVSNLEVDMSSEKEEFLRSYDIRKKCIVLPVCIGWGTTAIPASSSGRAAFLSGETLRNLPIRIGREPISIHILNLTNGIEMSHGQA